MSNSEDHSRNLFLEYYEDYIDAKDKKQPLKTGLKAVHCREQLQKIGDPSNEAQTCQDLFARFVTNEQAAKIYRDLYEDSRSYPGSGLPLPLLPEGLSPCFEVGLLGTRSGEIGCTIGFWFSHAFFMLLLLYSATVLVCWFVTRKFLLGVLLAVVVDVTLYSLLSVI